MTIANRICDLLQERGIPFTVRLMPHDVKGDWEIIAHPGKDQTITPKTPVGELWWWLN